jgi:hypothetical protein
MYSHHLLGSTDTHHSGYEEEASPPENYYAHDYHDDYSPSPPHASGGSGYYHEQPYVPPPTAPQGYTAHDNQSTIHVNQPPIPPYNPADYANQPHPAATEHNPYAAPAAPGAPGYPSAGPAPPRPAGENVSANNDLPRHEAPAAATASRGVPYFPPPPTTPLPDEQLHHDENENRASQAEEGASVLSPCPSSSTLPRPHVYPY